jgi:hypothetical protein
MSASITALCLGLTLPNLSATPQQVTVTPKVLYTPICTSIASPAVCSNDPAGFVAIPASGTSLTVNTTAVTATSQIFLQFDSSLGTALGSIMCNSAQNGKLYWVSARSTMSPVGFTITTNTAFASNYACLSYLIVN